WHAFAAPKRGNNDCAGRRGRESMAHARPLIEKLLAAYLGCAGALGEGNREPQGGVRPPLPGAQRFDPVSKAAWFQESGGETEFARSLEYPHQVVDTRLPDGGPRTPPEEDPGVPLRSRPRREQQRDESVPDVRI